MLIFALVWLPVRYEAVSAESSSPSKHILHVVYFAPANIEPHPGYRQRLIRVMEHIQAFYRNGMSKNGFGSQTFELKRDAGGVLKVHMVRGLGELSEYDRHNRDSKTRVRREVAAALARGGVILNRKL